MVTRQPQGCALRLVAARRRPRVPSAQRRPWPAEEVPAESDGAAETYTPSAEEVDAIIDSAEDAYRVLLLALAETGLR